MMQTSQINPFVTQDICDCDQRCEKCGKLKRQNQQFFPQLYPTYPSPNTAPANPWQPWITYTTTCTHQE